MWDWCWVGLTSSYAIKKDIFPSNQSKSGIFYKVKIVSLKASTKKVLQKSTKKVLQWLHYIMEFKAQKDVPYSLSCVSCTTKQTADAIRFQYRCCFFSSKHLLFLSSQIFHMIHYGTVLHICFNWFWILSPCRLGMTLLTSFGITHCTPKTHRNYVQPCQVESQYISRWLAVFPAFSHKKHLLYIEVPLLCKVSCVKQALLAVTHLKQETFGGALFFMANQPPCFQLASVTSCNNFSQRVHHFYQLTKSSYSCCYHPV